MRRCGSAPHRANRARPAPPDPAPAPWRWRPATSAPWAGTDLRPTGRERERRAADDACGPLCTAEDEALFVAQADDWILQRRAASGNTPEAEPDGDRYAERDEDRHRRHDRADLGEALDAEAEQTAHDDAGDPAG